MLKTSHSMKRNCEDDLTATPMNPPKRVRILDLFSKSSSERRKNPNPKKYEPGSTSLHGFLGPKDLLDHMVEFGISKPRFRVSSVIQKKRILEGTAVTAVVRSKVCPKVDNLFPRPVAAPKPRPVAAPKPLINEYTFRLLEFEKVLGWATAAEVAKPETASAMVKTLVVFVHDDGKIVIIDNKIAVVPMGEKAVDGLEENKNFCTKDVRYQKEQQDKVTKAYLVLVAERHKIRQSGRTTRGGAAEENAESSLEKETFYGCRLLMNKQKINDGYIGRTHIILVAPDVQQYPFLPNIDEFPDDEDFHQNWMKHEGNLEKLAKLNKNNDNSHLPRVFFFAEQPEAKNEAPLQARKFAAPVSECLAEMKTKGTDGFYHCPFRPQWKFNSIEDMSNYMTVRFGCYQMVFGEETTKIYARPGYFDDDISETLFSEGRMPSCRSFPKEEVKGSPLIQAEISSERKFGLDFLQSSGSSSVLPVIYQNRLEKPLYELPLSITDVKKKDVKKNIRTKIVPRFEFFPRNNPKMFTDRALYHHQHTELVKLVDPTREMQVVEKEPTREDTIIFNQKLVEKQKQIDKKKTAGNRGVKKDPPKVYANPEAVETVGVDFQGNPVHRDTQLFWPYGKMAMYNMYQTHYFSEMGLRNAAYSTTQKCRIFAGFVKQYGKELVENGLVEIFRHQFRVAIEDDKNIDAKLVGLVNNIVIKAINEYEKSEAEQSSTN